MSRYRLCAILAMVLCAVAYAFGRPNWCWLVLGIFVVLIGLGVAFPQLQFSGRSSAGKPRPARSRPDF